MGNTGYVKEKNRDQKKEGQWWRGFDEFDAETELLGGKKGFCNL